MGHVGTFEWKLSNNKCLNFFKFTSSTNLWMTIWSWKPYQPPKNCVFFAVIEKNIWACSAIYSWCTLNLTNNLPSTYTVMYYILKIRYSQFSHLFDISASECLFSRLLISTHLYSYYFLLDNWRFEELTFIIFFSDLIY